MKIDILTLFPEMFTGVLGSSILKKAAEQNKVTYEVVNFRDFTIDKHNRVDDYPYGGGAGMVLTPQPVFDAVEAIKQKATSNKARIILFCPQGEPYSQEKAIELSKEEHLILICGHYEGYDERIRTHLVTDEISIGDYVLTGGEIASMVVVDSVVRLLPDVLGNQESAITDSFTNGLLEHPHYTRPAVYNGIEVPEVLRSGNHQKIDQWRHKESLRRTYFRRKDLLENRKLTLEEKKWIEEFQDEDKGTC